MGKDFGLHPPPICANSRKFCDIFVQKIRRSEKYENQEQEEDSEQQDESYNQQIAGLMYNSRNKKVLRSSIKDYCCREFFSIDFSFEFSDDSLILVDKCNSVSCIPNFLNLYNAIPEEEDEEDEEDEVLNWEVPVNTFLKQNTRITKFNSSTLMFILYKEKQPELPQIWIFNRHTWDWT